MAPVGAVTVHRMAIQTRLRSTRAGRALVLGVAVLGTGLALALSPLSWLALALGGLVLAVLIVVRPYRALYLIALAIPFGSLFEIGIGPITVGVTEALLGLMLVAWLANHIALREAAIHVPPLAVLVLVFVGVALYSLPNATSLPLAAKELAKWLEVAAVVVFVANAVPSRQTRPIVCSLLAAGLLQALLGAYQFLTQSGPEGFVLHGRFMRAYGTFEQPNPYAGYLGLVAPLALAIALGLLAPRGGASSSQTGEPRIRSRWLEWFSLGTLALVSIAIGMSWSRGAWLGFTAAVVVVSTAQSRRARLIFGALVAIILLAGLMAGTAALPAPVVERLTSFLPFIGAPDIAAIEITDQNYAALERLAHWQSALDMWQDHPWLGVGFGNYAAAYAQYALPKWPMALGHAHNYYLNVAAETGLLGLVAYLSFWGLVFWHVWRILRTAVDQGTRALALGALGMLVHVSVHNVVDNLWVHNMYIHIAIVLGLLQVAGDHPPSSSLNTNVGVSALD